MYLRSHVSYEAYAVRFGVLPQFRVSGLVAGADCGATPRHPGHGVAAEGIRRHAGCWWIPASTARSSWTSGRRRTFARLRTLSRQPASSRKKSPTSSSRTRTGTMSTAPTSFRKRPSGSSATEYEYYTGDGMARAQYPRRHRRGGHARAPEDQHAGPPAIRRRR